MIHPNYVVPRYAQIQGSTTIQKVFTVEEAIEMAKAYAESYEKAYTYQSLDERDNADATRRLWDIKFKELLG